MVIVLILMARLIYITIDFLRKFFRKILSCGEIIKIFRNFFKHLYELNLGPRLSSLLIFLFQNFPNNKYDENYL